MTQYDSNGISKIPISFTDASGSFHMLKPGIHSSSFNSIESMSLVIAASSSFAIEADPDDISSIQFRIPSQSAGTTHDRVAFYISGSGEIGIGTKDPATSFDIRDTKQDVDPKRARTNKEALLKLSRTAEEKDIKAEKFRTARTIGGVSFDGSANINLPGVNTRGSQDTTGNAATATSASYAVTSSMTTGNAATATELATARSIGGVSFDGSRDINLPGVNSTGNQATTGNAGSATKVTVTGDELNASHPLTFIDNTGVSSGQAESLKASRQVLVNPALSTMTIGGLTITYVQGDGRSTFGTVTFTGRDAGGSERSVTLDMR